MPSENLNPASDRKLAAIMFADIQGYTALMEKDEARARQLLDKFHFTLVTHVEDHKGKVINNYGDGCLCTFDSAVAAVQCAKEVQQVFSEAPKVPVRIGLHSGDVFFEKDNVFGDAVNIASRIESMGVAGSVLLSSTVRNQVKNQGTFELSPLGKFEFKNVEGAMTVYALTDEGLVIPKKESLKGKQKPTKAKRNWVLPIAVISLALLAFFVFNHFSAADNNISRKGDKQTITIFPFTIKGSPDLQYLGEGMVDLISTKLDDITEISAIDPNVVFNELKATENAQPPLDEAIELSSGFGAGRFVLGNVVVLNDQLQVKASKYDEQGNLLSTKNVAGQKEELASLIDQMTRVLIADEYDLEGMEFTGTAAMTSQSLPALQEYLLGEQAFRKVNFSKSVGHYAKAVELDSTFALAWLRISDAEGWSPRKKFPQAVAKANEQKDRLPEKWSAYVALRAKYYPNMLDKINAYKKLEQQYGETSILTEKIADLYFHYIPAYGRSIFESRPYLQRAIELNPNNQEAFVHLLQLAFIEGDSLMVNKIFQETDSLADFWPLYKLCVLSFQEVISEPEILELVNHPKFDPGMLLFLMAAPEDAVAYSNKMLKFIPYIKDERVIAKLKRDNNALKGKEKAAFGWAEKMIQHFNSNSQSDLSAFLSYQYEAIPSFQVVKVAYLPLSEEYPQLFERLKGNQDPWALYGSWKYATVLQNNTAAQQLKTAIKENAERDGSNQWRGKFYYYSLLAFEAYSKKDNETALRWIDSTYQYSPGHWFSHSTYMDKLLMKADIYEQQGDYDKAIPNLENYPVLQNFAFTKGYASYRLTKLYELNGDYDKAFAKCNLFLQDYAECDEKYQPWVEEVKERRDRLMAKEL